MTNAIPSLSVNGFIKDNDSIMVKLYEYFITSEYSQSNTFYGEIASLKYILQHYSGIAELKVAIRETLTTMYSRYFTSVTVDVTINETDNSTTYLVDITATDDLGTISKLTNSVRSVGDALVNIDKTLADLHGITL